ncbi:hypothetical protein F5B19DRAFT_100722 [Rostrohypoxylon terebratum]|nr:hypothetical protein F5B19DRAFT_100722 [Rostrohypoxylon terebratum]
MAGNTVGFSFQADVTNTGSLLHTLTGRALKAMSDGGVDFYAVIAAITFGKGIVLRDSLGDTVRSHILSKRGFQSVLSKALSIGWGHKGLAVEMANTKAGTNSLLLIGALATGSSNFQAAQCFSELLSLRGCEPDSLPSVDVLKHMIGYFSPFVYDLGFAKVLENVTTTATRQLKISTRDFYQAYTHLTKHGDALGIAGGINQLFLTSQKKESYYAITRIRGAWFAAFAAHILGMTVELRLNGTVLWASAGSNGAVIFELGEHHFDGSSIQTISNQKIDFVESTGPECQEETGVDYLVGEMFESFVAKEPRISPAVWESIRRTICQTAFYMLGYSLKGHNYPPDYWNSPRLKLKEKEEALKETLEVFGFAPELINSIGSCSSTRLWSYEVPNCLQFLDGGIWETLFKTCDCNSHRGTTTAFDETVQDTCICEYVKKVIYSLTFSITTLMWCRFDAKTLRIRDVSVGNYYYEKPHQWDGMDTLLHLKAIMVDVMALTNAYNSYQIEQCSEASDYILGCSGGRYTVGFTALLQRDCYDSQYCLLSLWSGRASVNDAMRSTIIEQSPKGLLGISPSPALTLAPGSFVEPHYYPSAMNICRGVALNENAISVEFMVGSEEMLTTSASFSYGVEALSISVEILRCQHNPKDAYRVENNRNLSLIGFDFGAVRWSPDLEDGKVTQLIALQGNKLEQILMAGYLSSQRVILQRLACLQCCISAASLYQDRNPTTYVMMG